MLAAAAKPCLKQGSRGWFKYTASVYRSKRRYDNLGCFSKFRGDLWKVSLIFDINIYCLLRILILFFLLTTSIAGFAAKPFRDTVVLGSHFAKAEIGPSCYLRTGSDFERFTFPAVGWEKMDSRNISLSADRTHWIFVLLKNGDSIDKRLNLHLNHVQTGPVRLYVISEGLIDSSAVTGSILPLARRASADRMLSLPLTIRSGKIAEIYIKAERREIGMTFSPLLTDPVLNKTIKWENTALLIALSSIFIILCTAVMVLFYLPSKESWWFLVYVLFGFLYVAAASGYGSLYFWSSIPWFEENAAAFLASMSVCGLFQFSKYVLRLDKNYPRIGRLIDFFLIIYITITCIGFGLYFDMWKPGLYSGMLNIIYFFLTVCFCVILFISIYEAVAKKQRPYYWFVSIFSFYLLFSVATILFETGIVEYDYKAHTVFLIVGSVPQMTLTLLFTINKLVALLKQHTRDIVELRVRGERHLLHERLRISRELHDDLGATLSGVAMYSTLAQTQLQSANIQDAGKSLDNIKESSLQMVDRLNDMIWLMKPEQYTFTELNEKIEDYARSMAAAKDMEVKFANSILSAHILTFEQRHNIYLFCKEAINNAVKYSEGSELQFTINQTGEYIEYIIADNGRGFDSAAIERRNGLNNMWLRAREIGAVCSIQSAPGSGCIVSLHIPYTAVQSD